MRAASRLILTCLATVSDKISNPETRSLSSVLGHKYRYRVFSRRDQGVLNHTYLKCREVSGWPLNPRPLFMGALINRKAWNI